MVRLFVLLAWAGLASAAGSTADLARTLTHNSLDPEECYRVRELTLTREDSRFYFTDGYLIFGRPVAGRRLSAVFTADVDSGDAEVLLMPPNRSERKSLASFTDSPNLNEHFTHAVFLFTDDTYSELITQIRENSFNRKSPERGVLLEEQWSPIVRNLSESFVVRLLQDVAAPTPAHGGMLIAAVSGKKLGNFDVAYDPRGYEQLVVGQIASRANRTFFNTWASFQSRSFRNATQDPERELTLGDYRIEATLEPDLELRETTRVKVKARKRAGLLAFDISPSMHVGAVKVDGKPAEVFQRESLRSDLIRNSGNALFLIAPSEPLEPGREYEMELQAAGRIIIDAGNHVYYVGARGSWYPSHGLQFTTFDLTFRYPKDLDLVAAGQVVEDSTNGDWRVTRRKTTAPVRMEGFNLGRYAHTKVTRSGYTVEAYANQTVERAMQPAPRDPVPVAPVWPRIRRPEIASTPPLPAPPNPMARLEELASGVAGALEFMSARFGPAALPLLTVSPVPGTFGQGFPGLIYLSTLSYMGTPAKSMSEQQQIFFHEILQAHETAHQWWGNVVTAAGYHDEWLMEALANYSALLYLEKRKGTRALDMMLGEYKKNLLQKGEGGHTVEAAGPIVLGTRLDNSQEPRAWRDITYGKGSWIMHMLRRRMGDQRWQAMLAALCKRYAGKGISTDQFRRLAIEFLPAGSPDPKLENFFDQWVYGTGIPELKLSWSVKGKAPAVKLTGKITQSGVEEDFSVPAPVDISFGRGKTITHWVRTGSEPASFTVALPMPPVKVALDPGMSVLRR